VNWSGASPDEGRFPVRPSSLTPSAARRRTARKAGVTTDLRRRGAGHMAAPGRSQSGGLGKRAGRSMTRTMQRRNSSPVRDCWQRRTSWVATRYSIEEAWHRDTTTTGRWRGPTGVGSTARVDSTRGKVGKVSRVASALPHSEGAAYKRQAVKSPRACETDGWGRTTR